jgi:hypothetical protein
MNYKIKSILKRSDLLVKIKRWIWSIIYKQGGKTSIDVILEFPTFSPASAGSYADRADITIKTINQVFPLLGELSNISQNSIVQVMDIKDFPKSTKHLSSVNLIKEKFNHYGSDKSNQHNYHYVYGVLLSDSSCISNIFEIGLGTNNEDVLSNMGAHGKPGASLRAFRDHCPNAMIYGADVDRRILFSDYNITTFYVDQTKPSTFNRIIKKLPKDFDLVIDDGLHSPHANIASLCFGLQIIKIGGWVVVEDISNNAICFWQVTASILPPTKYTSYILNDNGIIVFAVQRLA